MSVYGFGQARHGVRTLASPPELPTGSYSCDGGRGTVNSLAPLMRAGAV
jgi:hypothetical protein